MDKYNGYHNSIQHKCECGNEEWYPSPASVLMGRKCKICSTKEKTKNQTKTSEKYILEVYNINPNIIVLEPYIDAMTKIRHQCECGNSYWCVSPSNVLIGRKCKICGTKRYAKTNTRTHEQYCQEVYNLVGDEYTVLGKYSLVTNYIKMRHNICNHEWDIQPNSFLNIGTRCPRCANERNESVMAITLKQVLKYYYKNTEWECDVGFRGLSGGVSRYDIFVPELTNLLIECQSEYHDDPKKQILDKLKKQYALDSKYNYLAIDNREYTPLEAIQIFFPKFKEVPEWVDVSMRYIKSTWDVSKAQNLLNEGYTIPKIGDMLNVSSIKLQSGIGRKSIIKPKNYKIKQLKQRKKIVQLDLQGNFIKEHEGITLVEGFTATNISACCRGKDKSYKGFRWMYAEDYYNNKDNIKKYKDIVKQPPRPVVQLSLDEEFIAKYNNYNNIDGFNKSGIWNCCNNKKKTHKGYKWMYLEDYEQKIHKSNSNIHIIKENKERIDIMNLKSLEGLTFVVTGSVETFKNRKELEELITSLLGKLSGSVSKNTNYLINNDISSTTGKNKKANDLGIEIISETQFNEMIGRVV